MARQPRIHLLRPVIACFSEREPNDLNGLILFFFYFERGRRALRRPAL
jgi:hypothetical protein